MTTVEVQPHRGKYRVVMRHDNGTITVLGSFNARHKAEHEAEQHRRKLGADDDSCAACGAVNPPGGLALGPEGGGAEYEWFCRNSVACAKRIAAEVDDE